MVYRSDVVGSLLRPGYLKEARQQYDSGQLTPAEFKRIEDRAVDEAIRLQEEAGLDVVTDGEQRRLTFFGHFLEAFEGFDLAGGVEVTFRDDEGHEMRFRRPAVVAKLRWRRNMCAEEFAYVRSRTTREAKVTIPSTEQAAAYWDPERSASAYPTVEQYLADVVDLLRREIEELYRLGCTYVQFDAPQYAALLDPVIREAYRQRGLDPDRMVELAVELDNAVIDGFDRRGMVFGLHICRGNNQSMFYASGGYEPIAEKVFARSRFHRFLLEYDDERSGDFEPLRHVPEDRVVVLGLVSTKRMQLESEEELVRRLREAIRYVPLERLAISPQCGFASTWPGNRVTADVQRQKLELVARVARLVWG